ncbi:MAG: recombinase family protein [Oscillospiraceae bacterium]|nr:recombinase family protein [Oscillospiraceae bacterium]
MNAEPKVTMFPATINYRNNNVAAARKRRTAGYARVSTDKDEQESSFEAQVDYYTDYIKKRDDYEFIEIYTDEGLSATSTAKREGFKRMIADALDGRLDLIITKSVSRFARNTVDTLTTVRKLKEKGVEVYFQKENIYTMDSKGELLITIMSSLAQEESRSISENVTWGQRKRMADGKISLPYSQFLGYKKGKNDLPEIVEEEAVTVRFIYRLFLEGKTPHGIAARLTTESIPTPSGKERWLQGTVKSILSNEKYMGCALLQKGYTEDFLTKKRRKNNGEMPQFWVDNSHPAIIEPEVFEMVQAEIKRRAGQKGRHSGVGFFAGRIVCGSCKSFYGAKVWHSTDKYRRVIWRCNHKYSNGDKCSTPHLSEDEIKGLFVTAFNKLYADKTWLKEDYEDIIAAVTDTAGLDEKAAALSGELEIVKELIHKNVTENAHTAQNQDDYNQRHEVLAARYKSLKGQLESVDEEIQARKIKRESIGRFIASLNKRGGLIQDFDEPLWHSTVDFATIHADGSAVFTFKDGVEITA